MKVDMLHPARQVRRGRMIALHCSGAGAALIIHGMPPLRQGRCLDCRQVANAAHPGGEPWAAVGEIIRPPLACHL